MSEREASLEREGKSERGDIPEHLAMASLEAGHPGHRQMAKMKAF